MFINLLQHRRVSAVVVRGAKAIMFALPVLLLVWLLNENYLLTPSLTYTYRPGNPARVVAPKTPTQLLKTADPKLRWQISVDNFLFHVTIPRLIEAVRVRVRLDSGSQPYVVMNAAGKKGTGFSAIIKATALDNLDWKHVSSDGITLWMRDKHISAEKITTGTGKNVKTKTITSERPVVQYDSVNGFRANPPTMDAVGLVGIDRMTFAKVDNYTPRVAPTGIGHTLRGSHQLYVYAADETLRLSFDKVDLNRAEGADSVTIRVARADQLKTSERIWLKTAVVGDDGISGKKGPSGHAQPVSVKIPNVVPGVYLIEISTDEDVLLKNIVSAQQHLSFTGRVFIAEGPAYAEAKFTPVNLQTNGSTVTVAANHDQGKQNVVIAGKKVAVKDIKVDHVVSKLSGITTIDIPKGDIIVTSDGLLSFGGTTLMPDGARNVDVSTATTDLTAADYIIADYVPQTDGNLEVDKTFRLEDLDLKNKTLTFSVDSPGMQASGTTLGLKDIRATLIRGSFPWNKIWKKLSLIK